ncbi:protein SLOW GREEN 1, chloroplastic [Impatiens glandulifera]|uniref:protein SLOW GREEN 1, chloroplastic n=1 Tax=Impatiens glandulifera TaxID=253017 RepID=UPI001FB0F0BB|nr:protein SLOW GREEN 1, chloroplastic [Impatiens glandulifera]
MVSATSASTNLALSHYIHPELFSTHPPISIASTLFPKLPHPSRFTLFALSSKHYSPCPTPTSAVRPHIRSSFSPLKNISNFCTEKAVAVLIGSFVLMGYIGARPVLATPLQKTSYVEKMEEVRRTENNDGDEETMCEKLVEQNPSDVEALKRVLYCKMRKGKTTEAIRYVEKLIDLQPKEVEWRVLNALCYEIAGMFSTAKRLFKQILKERPLHLRALHGLAMTMHKNHEGPAVFEMLINALQLARRKKRVTEERNIRILIAQMHVVKGELEEGLKDFQSLVDENPRDFRPYLCQGIIYSLMGKTKEAQEHFELYRSMVPEEFPERGFLDEVVLEAKNKSRDQLKKEFNVNFSNKNQ